MANGFAPYHFGVRDGDIVHDWQQTTSAGLTLICGGTNISIIQIDSKCVIAGLTDASMEVALHLHCQTLEVFELEKPSTVQIEEWFEVEDYASLLVGWTKFPQLRNDEQFMERLRLQWDNVGCSDASSSSDEDDVDDVPEAEEERPPKQRRFFQACRMVDGHLFCVCQT